MTHTDLRSHLKRKAWGFVFGRPLIIEFVVWGLPESDWKSGRLAKRQGCRALERAGNPHTTNLSLKMTAKAFNLKT